MTKLTLNDVESLKEIVEKLKNDELDVVVYRKVTDHYPKVGDFVKFTDDYVECDSSLTAGKYYEIVKVDSFDNVGFYDDEDDIRFIETDELGMAVYEKVDILSLNDKPLKVGDYVVPLESADDEYEITNTKMKLGKVVKVENDDVIRIEVVAHEIDKEVGLSYPVESKYFRKATDEEVAQVKAELEFANFAEGDKVRLISGGGEYPLTGYENGKIYTVKSPKCHHGKTFGYMVQLTGGSAAHGYAKPKQLEKVTADELAQAKAEKKWAKIGRKPGEFKKGDIVRVVEYTGAHEIGEIVELAEDGANEYLGNEGDVLVGDPEWFELIAPVESRVDNND